MKLPTACMHHTKPQLHLGCVNHPLSTIRSKITYGYNEVGGTIELGRITPLERMYYRYAHEEEDKLVFLFLGTWPPLALYNGSPKPQACWSDKS